MNHDAFNFNIHIPDFSLLLAWMTLICLLGTIIIAWPMWITSRFFLTKANTPFSIFAFELPFSFSRFKDIVDNTTEKTKDTIRLNLKLDTYFMVFAYLLLFFAGWFVLQRREFLPQESNWYKILWLPFAAWLFDLLENRMTLACLNVLTRTSALLLLIFSLLKWLVVVGYIVLVVMAWI